MEFNRLVAAAVMVGAVGLSGCQSASKALGMSKITPDEFRVITKAPLVVPPDFSLRPPTPGEPNPPEFDAESSARTALLGARQAEPRDDAEKALVSKAGGDTADVLIRDRVDNDFGDIAHKDRGFADKVMFWRKDNGDNQTVAPAPGSNQSAPIDPAAEAARLKALTGGQPIVIEQKASGGHIKLPGL